MLWGLTGLALLLYTVALAVMLSVLANQAVWRLAVNSVTHFNSIMEQRERVEYFLTQSAALVERADDRYQVGPHRHQNLVAQLQQPGPQRVEVLDFRWATPFLLLTPGTSRQVNESQLDDALMLALFQGEYWGHMPDGVTTYFVAADGGLAVAMSPEDTLLALPTTSVITTLLESVQDASLRSARPRWRPMTGKVPDRQLGIVCYMPLPRTQGYLMVRVRTDRPEDLQRFKHRTGDLAMFTASGESLHSDPNMVGLLPEFGPGAIHDTLLKALIDFRVTHGLLLISHQDNVSGWRALHGYRLGPLFAAYAWQLAFSVALYLMLVCLTIWTSLRVWRRALVPAAQQAERIAESEAFNRSVLHAAPVGLLVMRVADGSLVMQNEYAVELLTEPGVAGPPATQVLWRLEQRIGAAESTEASHEVAVAGHTLLVRFARAFYRGEPVLLCGMGDLAQQKAVEAALAQAKRAADEANEAKSRFLATMSHEIRTPLHAMLGGLELMGAGQLSAGQRERLNQINGASQSLLAVIDDVLDFSKIEAGELVLHPEPADPVSLLETVACHFASQAAARALQLYCLAVPELPRTLPLDRIRLTQVLSNLVGNAIKFTGQGKVVLSGEWRRDEQGTWLVLRVIDTGMGIARDDQVRLFEPFVQADSSRTRAHGGTGLGLSICHRLVALMGGRIELVSEPGLGSCFQVLLPCDAPAEPEPEPRLAGRAVAVACALREQGDDLVAWLRHTGAEARWLAPGDAVVDGEALVLDELVHAHPPANAPERPIVLTQLGPLRPTGHRPISLSRYARDALVDVLAGVELPAMVTATPNPSRRQVLVVDDHPVNRQVLCDQLRLLGQAAHGESDGMAAMRWLADHPCDLVLTDLAMPGMDGYTLARNLRAQGFDRTIVAITASVQHEVLQSALSAGIDRWLTKPLKLATLAELLRELGEPVALSPAPPPSIGMNAAVANAYRRDLATLDAALAAGNTRAFLAALHGFKGALAVMGHEAAVQACATLETKVAEQGLMAITPAYDALRALVRPLTQTGDDDAKQDSGDSGR